MCVLKFYFRISLGGCLVSNWLISPPDVNLVLLASHCGEQNTKVGCKAWMFLQASYPGM